MANFDDVFSEEYKPKSNYFKFAKVGDQIAGIYVGFKDQGANGDFRPQRIFQVKDSQDILWNVGIPLDKTFTIERASSAKFGDILGFKFDKEIPATKKGRKPTKSIEVFVKHVEGPKSNLDEPFPS